MPMKGGSPDLRVIDRWGDGVGWIAYPDEGMRRASHAIESDGETWVFDPVDVDGVDDLIADVGSVAGVVTCLDRHKRDAARVARRHDVAVHVPSWFDGVAEELDAPVERFDREVGGMTAVRVRNVSAWQEVALRTDGGLYVPEAVGTVDFFRAPNDRLGVHPLLRPFPPRDALGGLSPDRLRVGHGEGVATDAAGALRDALRNARRRLPAAYLNAARSMLLG
ncbi:MAG: hypothetical protein ABEJ43_08285 [Haloferacaceae archaeon]